MSECPSFGGAHMRRLIARNFAKTTYFLKDGHLTYCREFIVSNFARMIVGRNNRRAELGTWVRRTSQNARR
jgi:hypothetical protein